LPSYLIGISICVKEKRCPGRHSSAFEEVLGKAAQDPNANDALDPTRFIRFSSTSGKTPILDVHHLLGKHGCRTAQKRITGEFEAVFMPPPRAGRF